MTIAASAVARVVGIDTQFVNLREGNVVLLPQRIGLIGQGTTVAQATYSNVKRTVTSALEVGQTYGFGSPLHLAARQLLPVNGDGLGSIPLTVYPLDDDGSGVVSTGDITPSGSPTAARSFRVRAGGILSEAFVISVGDAVADITAALETAINAVLDEPIIAVDGTTVLNFTSKWKGASANGIVVEVVTATGDTPTSDDLAGNVFTITQPVGGLVNPSVQSALDQVGNVWETFLLNCMDIADTTTLDLYSTFGEGRWGQLVRKPLITFSGNLATTVSAAIAVPDARKMDWVNAQLVAPASNELPFVVAARQLARIAVRADSDPAFDYGSLDATGISPGPDGDQWDYTERDQAVKGGSSTIEVRNGVINLADTVSFYHPDGDPTPAYRYVVDQVKLWNILFNLDLIFVTPEWDGAPLIPDGQPTTNRNAKSPKDAIAAIAALIDSLALLAIISDPATAKNSITAAIDTQNPKRLNVSMTVQLAGNSNIIDITNNFGFFFGTAPVVA
jgi:phage tail sheath gpL-like